MTKLPVLPDTSPVSKSIVAPAPEATRFILLLNSATARASRASIIALSSPGFIWRVWAAQKRKVEEFLTTTDVLIGEFCDIQSGRDDSRAELQRALALAKRENARLIIARLDRFSRRVSFIASILEQGIGLVCAEMPHASDFQLHIFAALAQEERRLISERTKAALAEAKLRGKILGANGSHLGAKNRKAADEFAATLRAKLDADLMGRSYSEIARHLNDVGIVTATGRKFYPQTVKNYMDRLSADK